MTDIGFSEFASDDWGRAAAKTVESKSGGGFVGAGIVTALAATVAFAAWHHTSFMHSSWMPLVKHPMQFARKSALPPVRTAAAPEVPALKAAAAPEADTPRTGRVMQTPHATWLPAGMSSVDVARSGRIHTSQQVASAPAGMHDARVARSTRLALAEPALPSSLRDDLKATQPKLPDLAALPVPVVQPPEAEKQVAELTPPPLVALPSDNIPLPMPAQRPVAVMASAPQSVPTPSARAAEPDAGNALSAIAEAELPARGPVPAPRPASHTGAAPRPATPRYQLAYASPETVNEGSDAGGGLLGRLFGGHHKSALSGVGPETAVYSIKDAMVYMPNGTKLEAHSGMGHMTDNPHYTDQKMHGPTPPNIYNLTMRKQLFHGVRAVRMTPTDRRAMHGRDGMLAHTYMLRGRPGQSNGCVVFKHYAKFLQAFENGRISKMVVVGTLDDLPKQVASR